MPSCHGEVVLQASALHANASFLALSHHTTITAAAAPTHPAIPSFAFQRFCFLMRLVQISSPPSPPTEPLCHPCEAGCVQGLWSDRG